MKEKKKNIIPKNFFNVPRKIITSKEALKDVVPIKWSNEVKSKKKKIILHSPKEKKML